MAFINEVAEKSPDNPFDRLESLTLTLSREEVEFLVVLLGCGVTGDALSSARKHSDRILETLVNAGYDYENSRYFHDPDGVVNFRTRVIKLKE